MMTTKQTFRACGLTTINGGVKVRWSDNVAARTNLFLKAGASRCLLIELPRDMTKLEAVQYIKPLSEFSSPQDQQAIATAIAYHEKLEQKAAGTYILRKRGRKPKVRVETTVQDILNAVNS
jgi:hypothetical protein